MEEQKSQEIPKVEKQPEKQPEKVEPNIEELKQELDKGKQEISRLQGLLKAEQKRGVPKEEIAALHKRIEDLQEWWAGTADDMLTRISGDVEEKPTKKSYKEQLIERRKETPKAPEIDPDVHKFITYVQSQGLDFDDPLVQESYKEDRSPQEALKFLKGKVEEKFQSNVEKRAGEIAKTLVEQKLKDLGLTTSGTAQPSASKVDTSNMTPDQKLQEGFKQYTKKK